MRKVAIVQVRINGQYKTYVMQDVVKGGGK